MHTFLFRGNAILFYGISILFVMSLIMNLSFWTNEFPVPKVKDFSLNLVEELRQGRRKAQRAIVTFNIDVDLTPAFHWHVKQLFFYVVAEYDGDVTSNNQVVMFDAIIQEKEKAKFVRKGAIKYPLIEESNDLRGRNIRFKIGYEVFPLVGPLLLFSSGRREIQFNSDATGQFNNTLPASFMK